MAKGRDTYDGRRKAPGLPVPGIYNGRRADSDGPARDAAPTGDGVIYEPSFRNMAAAASKTTLARVPAAESQGTHAAPAATHAVGRADGIAARLAEVLEHEAMLYQDAADISSKKTEIIVHGKIEELDSLVKAEQAIILKIGKLEEERENIVGALSDELGLDLEGVTLTDINAHLGSESYARLDNCQKSLAETIGGLKNANDMNAQLIQNALDYVNFSVNLLTANQSTGSVYSPDGEDETGKPRRSIFDVKR